MWRDRCLESYARGCDRAERTRIRMTMAAVVSRAEGGDQTAGAVGLRGWVVVGEEGGVE